MKQAACRPRKEEEEEEARSGRVCLYFFRIRCNLDLFAAFLSASFPFLKRFEFDLVFDSSS